MYPKTTISKTKGFRYPPVLPIIYYEGAEDELSVVMMISKLQKAADFKWLVSETGPEYLKSVTVQSPEYLLNIISMVIRILLLKIKVPDDEVEAFVEQVKERRMGELFANFEEYDVQENRRLAREEARQELREELLELVREEVQQKAREELREEMLQLVQEEAIVKSIRVVKELTNSKEVAVAQLVKQYGLSEVEAREKVELNW